MGRDVWILFTAKAVRTFCYGYLGVLFPIYLARAGLDASAVGIAVALTLIASAAFTDHADWINLDKQRDRASSIVSFGIENVSASKGQVEALRAARVLVQKIAQVSRRRASARDR